MAHQIGLEPITY